MSLFAAKQKLAAPSRYYGDGGTIHGTGTLDVEVVDGKVIQVWFRCQMLPFKQHDGTGRTFIDNLELPRITGVEVLDPKGD